ncbi:MAG: DUF1295 domain-containing protein, partial [Asgard group archaeon]|nr:DUF1295 domain-containing protein [Asgard group archaeon]
WMFLPQAADANPIRQGIILGVVSFWGLRLTINWIRTWKGLHHEDWRYVKYRKEYPKFHWFIAFFGLEMMSTLIVYLGSLAMYPALVTSGKAINFLDIIGMIVAIGATLIEFIADEQLKVFCQMREKNSQVMDVGLWGLSRHPNYFGEIAFWWGLFFFALAADLSWWWTIAGPIAMVLLFNFISIPLMEERQVKRRPEYEEYQEEVSRLIPWFSKN